MAGFVTLWLGIFLPVYCQTKQKKLKILSGIFCFILLLGGLASQSDSVFLSVAVVLTVLGLACLPQIDLLRRWSELGIMTVLCSILFLLLRLARQEECWNVSGVFQIVLMPKLLAGVLCFPAVVFVLTSLGLYRKKCKGQPVEKNRVLGIVRIVLILVVLTLLAAAIGELIFTTHTMSEKEATEAFGSLKNYLYFGKHWGSNRGIIWRCAASTFTGMPRLHKLFGAGPACFKAAYEAYDSSMLYAELNGILVDAHNEFLQYLVTTGIAGVLSYFGIFVMALVLFFKNRKIAPLLSMTGICFVTAFLVQGFVNNTHLYIEPLAFAGLAVLLNQISIYFNKEKW